MPLIFMSGLFFPLSSYPAEVVPWVKALPTTALFEGARQALVSGAFPVVYGLQVSLTALVTFIVAVQVFRRKMAE